MVEPTAPPTSPRDAGLLTSAGRRTELVEKWSVTLPKILDPWLPQVANAFADDAWMAPWTDFAALGPLVTLGIGFLAPWVWPGMRNIFSESLVFLMLAIASAIADRCLGATLLFGYIAGDALHVLSTTPFFALPIRTLAGHVVGYLLFGVLAIRLPQLAQTLAASIRLRPSDATLRLATDAGLQAVVWGGLVFLWCQGTVVLIRPVFTWARRLPTDAAVMQVQVHWPWLVATAIGAAVTRVILEDFAVLRSPSARLVSELRRLRRAEANTPGAAWRPVPVGTRVALGAILLTMILAGTYAGWIDPLIVLIGTGAAGAWRAGLLGKVPKGWVTLMQRIPAAVRMAAVPIAGFLIADAILNAFWSTASFRPWMLSALCTLVLYYVAFPTQRFEEEKQRQG